MIVHLNKEEQRDERRKLLQGNVDVVYAICHDALKELQKEGRTDMSAVEVFLSARSFVSTMLTMGDPDEALEDEMEDLEDEVTSKDDAMIIMMVASALFLAASKTRVGFNAKSVILKIYERWNDHDLFFPILERFSEKEQARWAEGKKTNLLTYELGELNKNDVPKVEAKAVVASIVANCENLTADAIQNVLLVLMCTNEQYDNAFNHEVDTLKKRLSIKSTPMMNNKFYGKSKLQLVSDNATAIDNVEDYNNNK